MDVNAEGAVSLLRGDVLDPLVGAREGGVIDENVQLTECGNSALDNACTVLLIRDVARDKHDPAAGLLDPARGLSGVVFLLGQIGDQDISTFAGRR